MRLEVNLDHDLGGFRLEVSFRTEGGVTALFGPSGAGKSLILRHVAGLARAERGRVVLDGRVLFDAEVDLHLPPRDRRVGLVFQEAALFPHLSVGANIAYGLRGLDRAARRERVRELLALVELDGWEERDPGSLSGGERQRVALARSLAPKPQLLLLDEPFAALDFRVRRELRASLRSLQRRTAVPVVLITHSLSDVRELSDGLVLVDRGRVVAQGETAGLLSDPGSAEAAALLRAEDLG